MRSLTILGATGSIGASTLDLVRRNRDAFHVVALTGHSNVAVLAALAREFAAQIAVVGDEALLPDLRAALVGSGIASAGGAAALVEAARRPADVTVAAIVGCAGLAPTMAAIEQGRTVALANKESLIVGGDLVVAAAERAGGRESHLVPVDSEHSALAQALRGGRRDEVARVVVTASGGPFRGRTRSQLADVTVADALVEALAPGGSERVGVVLGLLTAEALSDALAVVEAEAP